MATFAAVYKVRHNITRYFIFFGAIKVNGAACKCVLHAFMPVSGEMRLFYADCTYFAPMHMNLTTANDNMPLGYNVPLGHNFPESVNYGDVQLSANASAPRALMSVSSTSPVRTSIQIQNAPTSTTITPVLTSSTGKNPKRKKPKRKKTGGRFPVYTLLLLWLLAAAVIARFAGSQDGNLINGENLVMTGAGFGLLSLWLASFARRRHAKISHSLGIAGACVSAAGLAWLYFSQQTSITASPELLVMGVAAVSLVFAKLWRTPFLLHISAFLMIGWTSYVFLNAQITDFVWMFPALWAVHMFLAMDSRIKRTVALSVFTGLYWIGVNLLLLA